MRRWAKRRGGWSDGSASTPRRAWLAGRLHATKTGFLTDTSTRTAAPGRTAVPDAYMEVPTLMVILMFALATRDPASWATTASKRRRTAASRSRPLDARSMSRPADAKPFTEANGLALFSAPLPPQGLLVRPGILGHAATRRLGYVWRPTVAPTLRAAGQKRRAPSLDPGQRATCLCAEQERRDHETVQPAESSRRESPSEMCQGECGRKPLVGFLPRTLVVVSVTTRRMVEGVGW